MDNMLNPYSSMLAPPGRAKSGVMLVSPLSEFQQNQAEIGPFRPRRNPPLAGLRNAGALQSPYAWSNVLSTYKQILTDGLWTQNPGLIQFLGICPLLAVSNSLVNGIGLGLATLLVLLLSNGVVSLLRPLLRTEFRLPVFVLVIATLVTLIDLYTAAWFHDLWLSLGIFLPLIVTNCVILARAESFASRQPLLPALVDGLAHGLGFAAVLIALGGLREIIGSRTLFADADMLFGPAAADWGVRFGNGDGFLLALLPPGAFLGLALLVALRNLLQQRKQDQTSPEAAVADTRAS